MTARKGEKFGWAWGWTGGFLWVPILGAVFLVQGKLAAGMAGLLLFASAIFALQAFAPWRHPTTPYWRLMAVGYAHFLLAAVWAIWAFDAWTVMLRDPWMWLWLMPAFLPVFIQGRRTWADGEPKPGRDA